jgi:hypothetical protein
MRHHHRTILFGACVNVAAMLVAIPIWAAPTDYAFDVLEIGPQHSHITVRLRNVLNGGQPIVGAVVRINADLGPATGNAPTMTEFFVARPGPGVGRYTIIPEPGMQVFRLNIGADVAGETEQVTAIIPLLQ